MFLGRWEIDDLLTFAVSTHTPSTGAATDADAVPAYRVYEDETGVAILAGNMALLDDANTTGFYSEQITLSAANGFEVGKSYTIYVSAVVGGVTGTLSHSFQVESAPLTAAQVNAEVDTALADYDGPTHAELVSEVNSVQVDIAALNDLSATEVEDAVWDAVLANHQDAGSTGEALDAAGAAGATPAAIADAVWDEVLAGHLTAGSTGEALDDASSPGGTIFPAGAIDFTYTVTDSVSGLPIEGVEVWISTDNPAVNIVWKGDTDAFGVARDVNSNLPALDAGVYYFWRQKAGYIFVDPDTETVS